MKIQTVPAPLCKWICHGMRNLCGVGALVGHIAMRPHALIQITSSLLPFSRLKLCKKMLVFVHRKYFLYKKYRNTIFCLCVCFLVICFFYVPSQLPMVGAGASKKKVSSGSAGRFKSTSCRTVCTSSSFFYSTSAHCIHRPVNNTKSSADVKKIQHCVVKNSFNFKWGV